jgi:hypothetical protein
MWETFEDGDYLDRITKLSDFVCSREAGVWVWVFVCLFVSSVCCIIIGWWCT